MPHTDTTPVSASIASTGLGIRYIGEHCFAYSGMFESSTSQQTALDFTSGSGYIIGTFQWNGFINSSDPSAGNNSTMFIYFNDVSITFLKTDTATEDNPTTVKETFLIPPFTRVVVYLDANETSSSLIGAANFTGRVYGAE